MAGKLPYYPLYVFDFDESPRVLQLDVLEIGLYILMLNEAWKRGSVPDNPSEVARITRRKPSQVKKAWAKVRPLWLQNGDGNLINSRQEIEREKAISKSIKASESVKTRYVRSTNECTTDILRASESISYSSSGLNTSSEESTSTRARSENSETPAEAAEVRSEWEKRFPGRVKPAERGMIATRVEEIIMPLDEWRDRMDAYKQSTWAKEQGYPLRGFLKDPRSWERLERKVYETPMAFEMRKSLDLATKQPTTVPELLAQFNNSYATEIISVYVEIGKGPETTFPVVSAFLGLFAMRTPEEQAAAAQNARMALIDRDPKWVKGLLKWWEGQPWTAANIPRQLKPPKDAAPDKEAERAEQREMVQKLREREIATYGVR